MFEIKYNKIQKVGSKIVSIIVIDIYSTHISQIVF